MRLARLGSLAVATGFLFGVVAGGSGGVWAASQVRHAASTQVFVEALSQNPDHLIPEMGFLSADNGPDQLMYDGLVRLGLNGKWEPDLATRWAHNATGTVWQFWLRHGVKWSDGQPFTAQDVLYTDKFASNPKINLSYVTGFNDITSVSAPNQYEVIYHLQKPLAMFLADVGGAAILPAHIFAGLTPTQINHGQYQSAQNPVVTGPYTLQSWVQNSSLTFVANPTYWGPKPKIAKFVFQVITNPNTAALDLEAGTVQMDSGLPPQYVSAAQNWPGVTLSRSIQATYSLVQLDEFHFLKETPVRVALNLASPKALIVQKIMKGQAVVAYGDQVPGGIWYDPHLPHPGYEPAQALKILLGDGFKKIKSASAPAGFWLYKGGQRLAVPIWTLAGNQQFDDMAAAESQAWENIGVYAPVGTLSAPDLFGQNGPQFNGKDEAIIFGWGQGVFPDDQIDFNWAEYPCKSATSNSENCERYSNPQMDVLTHNGAYTVNVAKAQAIYDKVQSLEISTVPIIFLFWSDGYTAYDSQLQGFRQTVYGTSLPWTWSLK